VVGITYDLYSEIQGHCSSTETAPIQRARIETRSLDEYWYESKTSQ